MGAPWRAGARLLLLALWAPPAAAAPAPWADEVATGDCRAALADPQAGATPAGTLVVATCQLRAGEAAKAATTAGSVQGALRPWALEIEARALLAEGRPAEALTALKEGATPSPELRMLAARALLEARQVEAAAAAVAEGFGALPAPGESAEIGLLRADLARARGDRESALALYRALWTGRPTAPQAELAATRLGELGAPVPDFETEAGREAVRARIAGLRAARLSDRALPLVEGLDTKQPRSTPEAWAELGQIYFEGRKYTKAAECWERAGVARTDAVLAFQEALATARGGDYAAARTKYLALMQRFPGTKQADEAHFKLGYMNYDAGRLDLAITDLTDYITSRPSGAWVVDARWFRAWSFHKLGDRDRALGAFDLFLEKHPGSDLAAAASYWRARLLGDDTALAAVATRWPSSSYAFFASERLGLRRPALPAPAPLPAPDGLLAANPELRAAQQLVDVGLGEEALPVLRRYERAARAGGQGATLWLADLTVRAGDPAAGVRLGSAGCAGPSRRSYCAPRPYEAVVTKLTAESGLDPLLPYAIMRAESNLDPSVTSLVGARGLMQLMPDLAKGLAQGRVPGFHEDDLYRAGINTRLGTVELGQHWQKYAHSLVRPPLPLVIAAYNGGDAAVDRWLGTYPTAPEADRFAEDISYAETRRYVRRVLGYLMEYRAVYGG